MTGYRRTKKGEEADFRSMAGGNITITDTDKFFNGLVKRVLARDLVFPITPNCKKADGLILNYDFDFKGDEHFEGKPDIQRKIIEDVIFITEDVFGDRITENPIIEKNVSKDNYHIIFNKIFGTQQDILLVRQFVKKMLIKDSNYPEKSDAFDLLKGSSLRLSLFDKGKNAPKSHYKPFDLRRNRFKTLNTADDIREYLQDTIPLGMCNRNFNKTKMVANLNLSEDFNAFKQEFQESKKKKMVIINEDEIDYSLVEEGFIDKLTEFFKKPIILSKFFNYENQYKLTLILTRFFKSRGNSLKQTVINVNNFYTQLADIDNSKVSSGQTYREVNTALIQKQFNLHIGMTFGTLVFMINAISEEEGTLLKAILPKENLEERLDNLLSQYYEKNNTSIADRNDFQIGLFESVLGSLSFPLNCKLMKLYFERFFIFLTKENAFYQIERNYHTDRHGDFQI
jgi:hypothetical protein